MAKRKAVASPTQSPSLNLTSRLLLSDIQPGIVLGDSLALMQRMPREIFHLAVVDPPYNINFEYDGSFDDNRPAAEYLEWSREWIQQVYDLLVPNGSFWLIIGDAFVSELDVAAKAIGFHKRSHVVHYFTFGVSCTNKFTPSHVHLLYFVKDKQKFTFNPADVKVPSMRQLIYNDKRQKHGGRLPDDTWVLNPKFLPNAFGAGEDTWAIPRVAGTHKERIGTPNQLPERLVGRIIHACSAPGDWVFDCFAGSGTVPVVATKLRRVGLGLEQSQQYFEMALKRYRETQPGDLLAGAVPQGDPDVGQAAS